MEQPPSFQRLRDIQELEMAREYLRAERQCIAEIDQIIAETKKTIAQSIALMAKIDKQSAWLYRMPIK